MRETTAAVALVLAACVTVIPDIPRPASLALFGFVFIVAAGRLFLDGRPSLTVMARPGALVGTLAVWVALGVGFATSPSADGLLRIGAFVGFSGAALFVLPSLISRQATYRAITVIAAAFAALGIITAFAGPVGTLDIYRRTSIASVAYAIPLSVFANPNTLGRVGLLGAVAAGGIALSPATTTTTRNRGGAAILGLICALAVVLSASRASLVALVAAGGVLAVARLARPTVVSAVTLGGLAALAAVLAAVVVVAPTVLTGRADLWVAALDATATRPVFGWGAGAGAEQLAAFLPPGSRFAGFGTHNSYVRLFFIGGIVGGVGYLLLCASALRGALTTTDHDTTTLALVVAVLVVFAFENGSVFGIAPASFVGALAFGFAQHDASGVGSLAIDSRSVAVWRWDVGHVLTKFRPGGP